MVSVLNSGASGPGTSELLRKPNKLRGGGGGGVTSQEGEGTAIYRLYVPLYVPL